MMSPDMMMVMMSTRDCDDDDDDDDNSGVCLTIATDEPHKVYATLVWCLLLVHLSYLDTCVVTVHGSCMTMNHDAYDVLPMKAERYFLTTIENRILLKMNVIQNVHVFSFDFLKTAWILTSYTYKPTRTQTSSSQMSAHITVHPTFMNDIV